jgi:hypothetical protein
MKITKKMQLYRLFPHSKSAVHVSDDVFAHHQEHLTVFTVDGKPEATTAVVVDPDDGHEDARNMLSCI